MEETNQEDKELKGITPDSQEINSFYKQFSNETSEAFQKISTFARDLNISIPPPEFVVIGKNNAGKSLLLESIFGHPIFPTPNTVKHRPLYITVINSNVTIPRITIKRDVSVAEDIVLSSIDDLPKEIGKRNAQTDMPIQIKYECRSLGNFQIIDTPPLEISGASSSSSNSSPSLSRSPSMSALISMNFQDASPSEKVILELVKPAHRVLLIVEEANDWESLHMIEWAKRIDSKLSRVVFAFSRFHDHLKKFSNQREFNQYFTRKPSDVNGYFWSGFSSATRDAIISKPNISSEFQTRVWQSYERDMMTLEDLKFDKKFEESIGVCSIRNHILDLTWRSYKDALPELRKQLTVSKKISSDNLRRTQDHLSNLEVNRLRSIASNYIADWLQIIVQLIEGSTEGIPAMTGQTLEEEFSAWGNWVDYSNRDVQVKPSDDLKNYDVRVYGGQQFERMMAVYKHVLETKAYGITAADIEMASSVQANRSTAYDSAWIASHIVQKKINDTFVPLIDQLCNRGEQIMQRLADIGFRVLEGRTNKRADSQKIELQGMRGYTFFQSHIKDVFNDYIAKISENCKKLCLDEIHCTQLIYWELTDTNNNAKGKTNDKKPKDTVLSISTDLYNNLRDTIVENVLLKCHDSFLVDMQRDLSGEVLKTTSSFGDRLIEEIFEIGSAKESLRKEEDQERTKQQTLQDEESTLRDLSTQFNRLRLVSST